MKVIHFIASIDKSAGGTTAYMKLLAEEVNNTIDVVVATGSTPNPVEISGVRVKFFTINISKWFSLQKEFQQFLENESPDLVHINGVWNPQNSLFQKVAQKLGIKIVLSPHGMLEPYILNRNKIKKEIALFLYQHKAVKNASFIHATAKSEIDNIEKLGYKQHSIIIPNGIKLSSFPIQIPEKQTGPKKILFLSRIHPKKGIEFLIDAWSKIQPKIRQGWCVEIVGNGEDIYIKSLLDKIKDFDLKESIKILEPVYGDKKITLFRESSVFVLPTYSENFGIVIVEAMASYTPVITTKGTPWKELSETKSGWWIDVGTEPLKMVLEEVLSADHNKLLEMGINGRELVKQKYSIEAVGNSMVSFYTKILNN